MSKVLPPITIRGIRYRVLRLADAARGPRFLLRNDDGDLFGLFARNAEPMRLSAVPIRMDLREENPLARVEFFDTDGRLETRS